MNDQNISQKETQSRCGTTTVYRKIVTWMTILFCKATLGREQSVLMRCLFYTKHTPDASSIRMTCVAVQYDRAGEKTLACNKVDLSNHL